MDSKNLKLINYNIDLIIFASIILYNHNLPSLELELESKPELKSNSKLKSKNNFKIKKKNTLKVNTNKINITKNINAINITKNINDINKVKNKSFKKPRLKKYFPNYDDYVFY